jgi:aldehyde:ferredoxin oxidoreductase
MHGPDRVNGYHGCYLRIDLARGSSRRVALDEGTLRRFIGGVGLGAWLLHREAPPGVDPLASEAPLVFAFSPLVGSPLTTSAKFAVLAKSPLTFRINDALSSSHFALAGKRTGADALVIAGACASPSVLVIEEGALRLDPADDLWGLPADAATAELVRRYGTDHPAAVIGPAGENRVRFATLSHGNRHAGRGGLGAVMGSKNLKALVVAGSRRLPLADPEGVVAAARDLSRRSFGPATAKYRELGTVSNLLAFNRLHALPTRNFQEGHFPEAGALSVEAAEQGLQRVARASCAACTIGCEHLFALAPGEGSVRLEYESLFALGPLCGVGERDAVLRAARLCDSLGLDTISAGATVAFAMECGERGLLPDEGLRFGNGDLLLSLLGRIARREGPLGDLLAEGTRRAAERIGGEAPDFAPHVKGLEVPGYEPRTLQTMALGFAVGSRGADHNRSGAYEVDFSAKGGIGSDRHGSAANALPAVETEDRAALMDSLILCKFLRGVFTDFWGESAELLRLVTGWDVDEAELRQAARRIVTAKKLYNVREGWTRAEDTLPPRFLREGLGREGEGRTGHRLTRASLDAMIAAYYKARGWTEEGQVPAEVVAALGLGELQAPARTTSP